MYTTRLQFSYLIMTAIGAAHELAADHRSEVPTFPEAKAARENGEDLMLHTLNGCQAASAYIDGALTTLYVGSNENVYVNSDAGDPDAAIEKLTRLIGKYIRDETNRVAA